MYYMLLTSCSFAGLVLICVLARSPSSSIWRGVVVSVCLQWLLAVKIIIITVHTAAECTHSGVILTNKRIQLCCFITPLSVDSYCSWFIYSNTVYLVLSLVWVWVSLFLFANAIPVRARSAARPLNQARSGLSDVIIQMVLWLFMQRTMFL